MTERYNVNFVFEEGFDRSRTEETVQFLDSTAEILHPEEGDVDTYVDRLDNDGRPILVEYRGTQFRFRIDNDHELLDLPVAALSIGEQFVLPRDGESDGEAVERMDAFHAFLGELYGQFVDSGFDPLYVYGLDFAESEFARDPDHVNHVSRERILDREVPGIYWFQIFPPDVVERLGEDRTRTCPAFRLEELSDGAVLLVGYQGVIVPEHDEYRDSAAEHLGIPTK